MPDTSDDLDKFLSNEKSMAQRKQSPIQDLLRQREETIKSFDERLTKLGYRATASSATTTKSLPATTRNRKSDPR